MIKKILIANRGEIAVRIIRAAKELGIATVAIYSDVDANTLAVTLADESYPLDGNESKDTYLRIDKILQIAKQCGADAIHPGYGFLAENAEFAKAVRSAGIKFVGPNENIILNLGSKTLAREFAIKVGVPVVPGYQADSSDLPAINVWAKLTGYPVLIKAAAGGGGRGMRVINSEAELSDNLAAASREAMSFFGSGEVFLEKYLKNPRHIEVQILGDEHGNLIHVGERECSLQRRHQKVIEEAPSPSIDDDLRAKLFSAALKLAQGLGYSSAGTVEFIVDEQDNYYFLEVNTRLQVEHPVTELVSTIDLVKAQLLIADGTQLFLKQADIQNRGHAIEVRVCAEDPDNNYLPSMGSIGKLIFPEGPGIRVDSYLQAGDVISPYYDSMLAKIICYGFNRKEALQKLQYALQNTVILGIKHNINFLLDLLGEELVQQGHVHTHFIEQWLMKVKQPTEKLPDDIWAELKGAQPCAPTTEQINNENILQNFGNFRNV